MDYLAAGKEAADEAAGSHANAIEEADVEKAADSLATKKNCTDKAAGSHAKAIDEHQRRDPGHRL